MPRGDAGHLTGVSDSQLGINTELEIRLWEMINSYLPEFNKIFNLTNDRRNILLNK